MNENTTGNSSAPRPAEPAVLNDPLRNRGVAFTLADREALGLTGRLPSGVLTLEEQARRAWQQLQAQGDDLAKNVYMEQLHDRNEVLYYRGRPMTWCRPYRTRYGSRPTPIRCRDDT